MKIANLKIVDKAAAFIKGAGKSKKRYLSVLAVFGFLCLLWAGRMQMKPTSADKKEEPKYKIVIDAGHGGFDPGKVGINGALEKNINLEISKKLKKLLEKENIKVVMTRTKDMGLYDEGSSAKKTQDLEARCALIGKENPLCTIGIHQNSFTDESVKGPQVFYYHTSNEGKQLAQAIQTQMNEDLEIEKPREVKDNGTYYMLKKSPSLTVLVECGFISNPTEADLLASEEYQQRVAEAICKGILNYIKEIENPNSEELEEDELNEEDLQESEETMSAKIF